MASLFFFLTETMYSLPDYMAYLFIFLVLQKVIFWSLKSSTELSVVKISIYSAYYANHPDSTTQDGSPVIIWSPLTHYTL